MIKYPMMRRIKICTRRVKCTIMGKIYFSENNNIMNIWIIEMTFSYLWPSNKKYKIMFFFWVENAGHFRCNFLIKIIWNKNNWKSPLKRSRTRFRSLRKALFDLDAQRSLNWALYLDFYLLERQIRSQFEQSSPKFNLTLFSNAIFSVDMKIFS